MRGSSVVGSGRMADPNSLSYATPAGRGGYARWVVCGLLFFATSVSYMDRQVIALLKPTLFRELYWTERDYTLTVQAFQIAYAAGYLLSGRLVDVIGVRAGLALAVAVWSAAAAGHGLARTVGAFVVCRLALGFAEGANFPAAAKAVGEWFPKRERATAFGLFNAGSNVRRDGHAGGGTVANGPVRVAGGVRRRRRRRRRLARVLARPLPPSGSDAVAVGTGASVHRERRPRTAGRAAVADAADLPGDVGDPGGDDADEPGLVVLPVLGAGRARHAVPPQLEDDGAAAGGRLPDGRRRQLRRRVPLVVADPPGVHGQRGPQARPARLRDLRAAGPVGRPREPPVGGGRAARAARGRPSGVGGQHVHAGRRRDAQVGRRVGRRPRPACRGRSRRCSSPN